MSVAPGDILHVVIEALLDDGTVVQNRKRFYTSAASPLTDSVVLNAVKTWVETLYAYAGTLIRPTVELRDGTVDVIAWNPTDMVWEVIQNVGIYSPLDTFSGTGDELPNQVAGFVVGNTDRPRSKGKIFAFPFTEVQQNHGIITTAAMVAFGNFAAHYILDQPIGADNLISGIVREAVNEWLPFTSATYGDILGTQRRRRFTVGI